VYENAYLAKSIDVIRYPNKNTIQLFWC